MRESLFKGKTKPGGEWVEGDLVRIKDGKIESWYIYGKGEVIPETVGRYIGLTDKNEKKIFRGDIGRYKQTDGAKQNGKPIICTGKVIYNPRTASYAVEGKDERGCKCFDYFPIKDFEVIGNIHDNPELLEAKE